MHSALRRSTTECCFPSFVHSTANYTPGYYTHLLVQLTINTHTMHYPMNAPSLFLAALLLGSHNPEVTIGRVILGSLGLGRALLRDLTPAPGRAPGRISGTTALGRGGRVDKALVSELLAADKLLRKVARVDSATAAVDGFGDELSLGREKDEVGNELLSWEDIST